MRDVGHCMMPYDKDDEFGLFYDFSRAYRDLPQKPMIKALARAINKSKFWSGAKATWIVVKPKLMEYVPSIMAILRDLEEGAQMKECAE